MIIQNNAVDLTNVNLLVDDVGGLAASFLNHLTETNAKRLVDGYNLIAISDPDNSLAPIITEILISESTEIALKKETMLSLILNNIIATLRKASVYINEDMVTINDFDTIYNILNMFTIVDGVEDLMGISIILENQSITALERFIKCYGMVYMIEEEVLLEPLYGLIKDVSEVTVETIKLSLILPEINDIIPDKLISRIKANKELINNTFVGDYIRADGNIGLPVESLLGFFKPELTLLRGQEDEFPMHYYNAVAAIIIISDVNNESLQSELISRIRDSVEDLDLIFDIDNLISKVKYE